MTVILGENMYLVWPTSHQKQKLGGLDMLQMPTGELNLYIVCGNRPTYS